MMTTRRSCLQGVGGASTLPLLDAGTRVAGVASRELAPPTRFLVVGNPLGMHPANFFPQEFGKNDTLPKTLRSLDWLKERMARGDGLRGVTVQTAAAEASAFGSLRQNLIFTAALLASFTVQQTILADEALLKPFFLYRPWTSPHAPIVPTTHWQGKTKAGGYGDFVAQSDHHAGQVLKALDDNGFREDTIVVFTADNGPERYAYDRIRNHGHRSSGPLRGLKRDIWEGGHRVPFIVRWPGVVQTGTVTDGLMSQIDIIATLAAIVGFDLPPDAADESHEQLSLWQGSASTRTLIVHNTKENHYAIRQNNWVLIDAPSGKVSGVPAWFDETYGYKKDPHPAALFDLSSDLSQCQNLFADQPQRVKQLQDLLPQIRKTGEVRAK